LPLAHLLLSPASAYPQINLSEPESFYPSPAPDHAQQPPTPLSHNPSDLTLVAIATSVKLNKFTLAKEKINPEPHDDKSDNKKYSI
jgi:hypothetical protein